MLPSLLFTLQLELHIARNSHEALLKYKQGFPKLSMITFAVSGIGLELKLWNTEEVGEVRSILPARKENSIQLDGISSIARKIMANWLGWIVTDSKKERVRNSYKVQIKGVISSHFRQKLNPVVFLQTLAWVQQEDESSKRYLKALRYLKGLRTLQKARSCWWNIQSFSVC